MKRDPLGKLLLFTLLVILGGLAAVTRMPDAWWVSKVSKAAVFGPWIERLADLYRRGDPEAREVEASDLEGGVEVIYRIGGGGTELRPTIQVEAGSALYEQASETSSRLATLPEASVELLDRRRDWYEVDYGGLRGWIFVPEGRRVASADPEPPLGSEPKPPRPVPSRPPDPEVLAAAVELLAGTPEPRTAGPYRLYTDERDRGLLIFLSAIASQLEFVYEGRYGLEPLPGAQEAVVLFAAEADYRRFLAGVPKFVHTSAPGILRDGVVATYSEGRGWSEIAGTLIHELTHLVNKRALGPALPPWLDEGIADDLAQSRIDGLKILPGTLGGSAVQTGSRIEYRGAQAAVLELGRTAVDGELPPLRGLLELDADDFQLPAGRTERYAQASFFVRSLLDASDPSVNTAFRAFLRDVSEGRSVEPEALLARLGLPWQGLDSRLASFLERQALEAGLPVPTDSGSSSLQASEPSS